MRRLRGSDGSATVELAVVVPIVLLLAMGFLTVVQALYDSHRLASSVGDVARYATRADYLPEGGAACENARRRTLGEVQAYAVAAARVDADDVTVSSDPCLALPGHEIEIVLTDTVSNPLYLAAAGLTNALSRIVGGDDVFPTAGLPIRAEASTYVE